MNEATLNAKKTTTTKTNQNQVKKNKPKNSQLETVCWMRETGALRPKRFVTKSVTL